MAGRDGLPVRVPGYNVVLNVQTICAGCSGLRPAEVVDRALAAAQVPSGGAGDGA